MQPSKVTIDRNKSGIYATATVFVQGKAKQITIWSAPGQYADQYKGKSDEEIKQIASDHYNANFPKAN